MKSEKIRVDPIYAFRLSQEDKSWLEGELGKLKTLLNTGKSKDTKVIMKNDILIEALKIGFKEIRARKRHAT